MQTRAFVTDLSTTHNSWPLCALHSDFTFQTSCMKMNVAPCDWHYDLAVFCRARRFNRCSSYTYHFSSTHLTDFVVGTAIEIQIQCLGLGICAFGSQFPQNFNASNGVVVRTKNAKCGRPYRRIASAHTNIIFVCQKAKKLRIPFQMKSCTHHVVILI